MPKDSNRPRRVAELLQRELAVIIPRELGDPRVRGITLTHVKVAADLSAARVYFSLLSGAAAGGVGAQALNHASGFLRRALRARLALRAVPALRFYYDESVARGAHLASLIDRAVREDRGEDGGEGGS